MGNLKRNRLALGGYSPGFSEGTISLKLAALAYRQG
jgi:hypothetical protein